MENNRTPHPPNAVLNVRKTAIVDVVGWMKQRKRLRRRKWITKLPKMK